MSLARKDIRAKLDEQAHAALVALCAADGVEIGEFVERIVLREVQQRFHAAIELARAAERLGITGNGRELSK